MLERWCSTTIWLRKLSFLFHILKNFQITNKINSKWYICCFCALWFLILDWYVPNLGIISIEASPMETVPPPYNLQHFQFFCNTCSLKLHIFYNLSICEDEWVVFNQHAWLFIPLVFLYFHFFSLRIVVAFHFLRSHLLISSNFLVHMHYLVCFPFMFQFWCLKAGTGIVELIALEISKQVPAY